MLRKPKFKLLMRMFRPSPIWAPVALFVVSAAIFVGRTQLPFKATILNRDSVAIEGPVKVRFNQDIAPSYTATISPQIPGQWEQKHTPLGVYEAVFVPDTKFKVAYSYTIHLTGLKRAVTKAPLPDIDQAFTTEISAGIRSISPANNSKDVSTTTKLTIVQSDAERYPRKLVATLTPKAELKQISAGQTLEWEPVAPLKQGTLYTFAVEDPTLPAGRRLVVGSKFTTVTPPVILRARHGDHFTRGQTVDITFDQAMEQTSDGFKFDFAGKGSWASNRTYRYVPDSVSPGKTYTYTVKKGIKSKLGGVFEATRKFQFATNGAVTASFYPGGTVSLNTPMHITFDQPVSHVSAEHRFGTSPKLSGHISWSGNTMTFSPSGEGYQTGYTFQLNPGVAPEWGLPSTRVLSGSYTTIAQVKMLNVPLYKQPYGRSCELTSLRMLLAYRGIQTSEMTIVGKIGYHPRARNMSTNTWDNPHSTFVGYIDTFDWKVGYGVFSEPIAAAARSYGRGATSYYGVSAAFIAAQVYAGNPVEVWGHIGADGPDSWNTSSGVVRTTTAMHARVVYGVVGSKSNPSGFWVNDAWYGSKSYWSAGALLGNMNAVPGVSNQAVVVR